MRSGGLTMSNAAVAPIAAAAAAMIAPRTRRPSVRGPSSTGTGISTAPYGSASQRPRSRSRQASQSPPAVETTQPVHRTPSRRGYPKYRGCPAQYRISMPTRRARLMPQPKGRLRLEFAHRAAGKPQTAAEVITRLHNRGMAPWAMLALVTAAHALGSFSVLSAAPLAPFLVEALHLTRAQVGLFLPAAYFGGVLMSLPAGWLTDRVRSGEGRVGEEGRYRWAR